jgi:hypothetical protein
MLFRVALNDAGGQGESLAHGLPARLFRLRDTGQETV